MRTKKVINPTVITQHEHHENSGAGKELSGTFAHPYEVLADSTVVTPLSSDEVLRVTNTTGATVFLYIGEDNAAVPAIGNSLAIPASHVEVIFCGEITKKELYAISSNIGLQVIRSVIEG